MSHQGIAAAFEDVATMADRSVRLARRNVDSLFASILMPLLMMALFVYVFGGAISTGTEYINYVVPGILLHDVVKLFTEVGFLHRWMRPEAAVKRELAQAQPARKLTLRRENNARSKTAARN